MNQGSQFGVNVWWTLPETSVEGSVVQSLLVKHGFELTDMKMPSRQAEVSRAAYSFQNRRGKENRRVTEKARNDGKLVTYGILDRQQSGDEVSFAQHTTVKFNKLTGDVEVDGTLTDAYQKALVEFRGKITDADIRYFLRNVIRMCYGVAKRPTGGIYFVPAKFASIIDQAKELLTEINSGARIYVERVTDGSQERSNVWESVEADVEDRLAKVVSDVERMTRLSAIKGRTDDIEEAAELMKVYQQLLGEEAKYEGLAEKIEAAVRMVSEKITGLTPVATVAPVTKTTMTAVEATVAILTKEGKALSYREIMDKAVADGIFASNANDPYVSFNGTLTQAVKTGNTQIEKIGRGVYTLKTAAA